MLEHVYQVRLETLEPEHAYHYLVGIECGLHQLTKQDSAQSFVQSAFLTKHPPGRRVTIHTPEHYAGDTVPNHPRGEVGCGCWTMEI